MSSLSVLSLRVGFWCRLVHVPMAIDEPGKRIEVCPVCFELVLFWWLLTGRQKASHQRGPPKKRPTRASFRVEGRYAPIMQGAFWPLLAELLGFLGPSWF